MLAKQIEQQLNELKKAHLARQRQAWEARCGQQLLMGQQSFCSFISNDYLGLSQHPEILKAQLAARTQFGASASGSALVSGYTRLHQEFEERMAAWLGYPRALLCNSGFMANLAGLQSLGYLQVRCLLDAENHASLNDGTRLARLPFKRFASHSDSPFLKVIAENKGQVIVVTDGVFSMSGRIADLPHLAQQCQAHQQWLMVDDAHGIGVIGESGKGSLAHHGLKASDVDLLSIPLGKSFAGLGGMLLGQSQTIEYIVQKARSYIYTTSLPPSIVAGLIKALEIIQQETWRQQHLQSLINYFGEKATAYGLSFLHSKTAIQAILIQDHQQLLYVAEHLKQAGLLVAAIRPPTVAVGTARLRIVLTALHQKKDIDYLLMQIANVLEEKNEVCC